MKRSQHVWRHCFRITVMLGTTAMLCCVGNSSWGSTPSITSTSSDEQANAARALLQYVPVSVRGTCRTSSPDSGSSVSASFAEHVDVELVCGGGDGADVVYYDKISDGTLDQAFDAYLLNPLTTPDNDCDKQGSYQVDGEEAGRWACYKIDPAQVAPTGTADHAVELNWTDSRSKILVQAIRGDGDSTKLNAWWDTTDAGPLSEPTRAGIPAAMSVAQQKAAQKQLLAHIPAAVRKTCTPDSLTDEKSLGETLFPWRVWLRASVTCGKQSQAGVDFVGYESFANSTSMTAHLHQYPVRTTTAEVQGQCEGEGDYDHAGKRAGEYQCTYFGVSGPVSEVAPHGAALQWSYAPALIDGEAVNNAGDPAPIYKWWKRVGGNI
jgi:hypothetical protein